MISTNDTSTISQSISTTELAKLLEEKPKNLTIVDANFGLDSKTWVIAPYTEWDNVFKNERIPTARFVNVSTLSDKSKNLPYMIPPLEQFTQALKDLDIGKNDYVVIYGDQSVVGAVRFWWMLKVFGFTNVHVLNGKFTKWQKEGLPVETGDETWKANKRERTDDDFSFVYNEALVTSMEQIKNLAKDKKIGDTVDLVDARTEEMFLGETNQQFGHIPGSKNIVYTDFLDIENDETFKSPEELKKIIESKKVDLTKPIISSCRGGITANVLSFGLSSLGAQNISLYDGAWTEWIKYEDNPIERGPAN